MKVLFVTYCFGNLEGQALIGVYKRALRVALELHRRGHEVYFSCTGREQYRDSTTAVAEQCMNFVEIPHQFSAFETADENRRVFLAATAGIAPDLIVIGEAPLSGTLLQAALTGGELGIPVVILDNAYAPSLVKDFCRLYGPMADGIILTGPQTFLMDDSPGYLCQVPPYIETAPQAVRALFEELDLKGDRLVAVLAYDVKVEQLGVSLLGAGALPEAELLFITRDKQRCRQRLSNLPEGAGAQARVIDIPPDPVLFGCLELARLAIIKYGFMQTSECLALRTPSILVYYEGPKWTEFLPRNCESFLHVTERSEADAATIAASHRLLQIDLDRMDGLHNGRRGAAIESADFLENLPRTPRRDAWRECLRLGFTEEAILQSLKTQHPKRELSVFKLRASCLRNLKDYQVYSLLCGYYLDGERQHERWWGRLYSSRKAAKTDFREAVDAGRHVLYFSDRKRIMIEFDVGEELLPRL